MVHYFGAHNTSKDLIKSAKKIKKYGGNLMQIFLDVKNVDMDKLIEFKNYLITNDMKVVVHSSYFNNIGKYWDEYSFWIQNIIMEIELCHVIGAFCLVLHLGKKLDLSVQETYNNMYTSLIYIHNKTKLYEDVVIALETSSGQGSEVCTTLNDLAYFYSKFSNNSDVEIRHRIKLCMDTCHIYQAGFDKLENKKDVKLFLEAWNKKIGINNIVVVHLNNCMYGYGNKRDVHANIFIGKISENAMIHFYKFFRKCDIPIILETPNNGYKTEIELLLKK